MRDPSRPFEDTRINRQFRWIVIVYLLVVTVLVAYNARAVARQRGAALIVNVAGRQRALAERYVKDVMLELRGDAADARQDAIELRTNDNALLHGGEVLPVQGADGTVTIPPAGID
jgi:high-affinity K+ transport system ATPase subunit B